MIVVDVIGAQEAAGDLRAMAGRVLNLTPAFFEIGDHFRTMVEGQFAGGAWAALRPYTIAEKGHATKLVRTGGMKQSWITRGAPGNVSIERARTATFGSEHGLVHWHQWGTSRMVARPVDTGPSNALNQAIVDEISEWIING